MDAIHDGFIVLFFSCITLTGLRICQGQSILEEPVHTAAFVGEEARFNFSASFSQGTEAVKWSFYQTFSGQPQLKQIYNSVAGLAEDADPYYDVDVSESQQYDLIIPSVSTSLAGKYQAGFALSDLNIEPQLVVLSNMQCLPNTEETVREDVFIEYTCKVNYKGYKRPSLQWIDANGLELFSILHHNTTTGDLTLKANVTATWEHDQQVMTCNLYFEHDGGTDPPPTLTTHCQSHYRVEYYPNKIDMYPDPSNGVLDMTDGDYINCTANGNPDPEYRWDCNGGYHDQGPILMIDDDLIKGDVINKCNCSAISYISGTPSGYFKEVHFRAYAAPDGGSNPGSVSAGVIAAAVIVPLVVIGIAVALGVYFFMKREYRRAPTKDDSVATPPSPHGTGKKPDEKSQPPYQNDAYSTTPTGKAPPSQPQQARPTAAPRQPYEQCQQPPRASHHPYGGQPTPFAMMSNPGGLSGMPDSGARMLSSSVPSLNRSTDSLHEQNFSKPPSMYPAGSQV